MSRPRMLAVVPVAVACAPSGPTPLSFAKGFLFGASIAGFQVDMGCPTIGPARCEDRQSDWYQGITDPRILSDPEAVNFVGGPPSTGPGFDELYPKDVERAGNELHHGAERLSIEWSRILPTSYDPKGIDDLPMFVTHRHRVPSIVTEHSVQAIPNAPSQEKGLVEYLEWLHRALADVADARGYFCWTLVDNYEWNHGMAPEDDFGLFNVDPNDPRKTRLLRPVGAEYARIGAGKGVPVDLEKKFPIR